LRDILIGNVWTAAPTNKVKEKEALLGAIA